MQREPDHWNLGALRPSGRVSDRIVRSDELKHSFGQYAPWLWRWCARHLQPLTGNQGSAHTPHSDVSLTHSAYKQDARVCTMACQLECTKVAVSVMSSDRTYPNLAPSARKAAARLIGLTSHGYLGHYMLPWASLFCLTLSFQILLIVLRDGC